MIFLQILKIIGIILLVLLGLIILILLLVLFDPVFYRVKGNVDSNKPDIDIKVHWLFYLIYASGFYKDGEAELYYRYLNRKNYLYGGDESEDEKNQEDTSEDETQDEDHNDSIEDWEKIGSIADEESDDTTEHESDKESDKESDRESDDEFDDDLDDDIDQPKKSFSDRLSDKWKNIKKQYRKIRRNYRKYKRILLDEKNHDAVAHLWRELIILIKACLPRRFKLSGTYSLGSPDTTAYVIGFLAMFPFSHTKDFKLIPDFESDDKYFQGDFDIKGRVYVWDILLIIIRVVFDKKCRRLYNMIKKNKR